MEFRILKDEDSDSLARKVQEKLNYGFQLDGQLQVATVIKQVSAGYGMSSKKPENVTMYIQTMIKNNES